MGAQQEAILGHLRMPAAEFRVRFVNAVVDGFLDRSPAFVCLGLGSPVIGQAESTIYECVGPVLVNKEETEAFLG